MLQPPVGQFAVGVPRVDMSRELEFPSNDDGMLDLFSRDIYVYN
jgi:hypothetical protein